MIQTYAVYYGALIAIWFFAFFADKYDKKFLIWFIIAILTMVAGFRKYTVGIDSYPYYEKLKLIASGEMNVAYGLETSFKYICYFLLKIWNNYTFVFSVFAFLTSYLIVIRMWDLRKLSSFTCSVVCYYMGFYAMSMNTMRQFVAIAIIFFGTRYLVKTKMIPYIISVLIAMLFHKTGVVGLLLLVIMLSNWREVSYKKRAVFLLGTIAVAGFVCYIIDDFSRYQRYMSNADIDIGMMVFGKLIFFIATAVLVFAMRGNFDIFSFREGLESEDKKNTIIICLSYFIGIFFSLLSYVFPVLNRIGWYFFVFEGVYMGMLLKTKAPLNKLIYIYCVLVLVGWGFYTSIADNSQGTVPYLFFWQ